MRARAASILLLSLSFAATSPAHAQWNTQGVLLCQGGCSADVLHVIPAGDGGAFIAWRDHSSSVTTGDDVYLQRISAAGTIAPGWPGRGVPVCVLPQDQNLFGIAPDGQGGVLLVWQDGRNAQTTGSDIYAQRILGDGSVAPGWPVNGGPVTNAPAAQNFPAIAPDGEGGAFVAFEDWSNYATQLDNIYVQHLTATGVPAPGWPTEGLQACIDPGSQGIPGVVPDGAGGAIVLWVDSRRGTTPTLLDIYGLRIDATGATYPGWAENGNPLALGRTRNRTAPDKAGGFYLGCALYDAATGFVDEYWAYRFDVNGAPPPGWPALGARVCAAPDIRDGLFVAPDGLGGFLMSWYDYRPPPTGGEIYAARVLADGSLAPGWAVDGTLVSDPAGPGFEYDSPIAPDGLGGAYVVWQREGPGILAFIQHLTAVGSVTPGWPEYGQPVSLSSHQRDARAAADGRGGVIVVWDEGTPERRGAYAHRFGPDGPTAIQVALMSAEAEPSLVRLAWAGAGLASASVERRTETESWISLATIEADRDGWVSYEDRSVMAGTRYAYRLRYADGGEERVTTETWVEVPAAFRFALEGARPNPSSGAPTVAFTLASGERATLELFDLAGRRVASREVGALGPGRHSIRLAESSRLAAGVYVVRLTQGQATATARAVVVK